jgi:hypothetical protein
MKVQLKGVVDKMVTWCRGRTRAYVDLAVIAAAAVPLYLFLIHINAFDLTYAWSLQHEGLAGRRADRARILPGARCHRFWLAQAR